METRRSSTWWLPALGAALLFGFVAGWSKGDGGGLRGDAGNLSAPWLLVAILPAWRVGSVRRGAAVGLTATMTALAGFYVGGTVVMGHHLGFATSELGAFHYIVAANRVWFVAGLISGPVCGGLAALAGRRAPRWMLGAVVAALLIGEIAVVRVAAGHRIPVLGLDWGVDSWRMYWAECLAGLLVAGSVAARAAVDARP